MKIRTKIYLELAAMGMMLSVTLLLAFYFFQEGSHAEQKTHRMEASLSKIEEIKNTLHQTDFACRDFLLSRNPDNGNALRQNLGALHKAIRQLKTDSWPAENQAPIQSLVAVLNKIIQTGEQLRMHTPPTGNPRGNILLHDLNRSVAEASQQLQSITSNLRKSRNLAGKAEAGMNARLLTTLILTALFLAFLIPFSFFYFSRTIASPLRNLMTAVKKISEGDFSFHLKEDRKDEFGGLHRAFNYMLNTLKRSQEDVAEKNLSLIRANRELEELNEKYQLSNEELESANEELQISNEELESTNEEINLSNQELETKTQELETSRKLLKKNNQELAQAHTYLETILNNASMGICVITPDHRIRSTNHALQKMLHHSEAELNGQTCHKIFRGQEEPCTHCPTDEIIRNGLPSRYQHRLRSNNGNRIIAEVSAIPLFGEDGKVEQIIETINDVTEVTTLTEALMDQKERMESILMNMGEGVCVINKDYEIEFVNDPIRRHFGEIVGRKCYKVFRGFDESCKDEVCSLTEILGKKKTRFEVTKRNEDGRYYRMTSVPLKNPDGSCSMIQIRQDVTDRQTLEEERKKYLKQLEDVNRRMEQEVERRVQELREANAELRLTNERLKELNLEKSEFIDIAVHDLRTPLTSIVSYADLLQKYPDEPPETRQEFLGIITQESFRMTQLINDYLDLSKLESGFVDFKKDEIDLHTLILDMLQTFDSRLREKKIHLETEIAENLPGFTADTGRLKQVISNLMDNAIKFTPRGGKISVRAETIREERLFRFSVRDSGPGIEKKFQDMLFKKFGRVMDKSIRKNQGSGLGLSVVKNIVEHYGGNIWVQSRKGKGATFFFTLPLDRHAVSVQHVIEVHEETDVLIRKFVPLWKSYLARDFACAFFGSPEDIDRTKEILSGENLPTYELMEKEQLIFSSARTALLHQGQCDGKHLFNCVRNFYDQITQSAWKGLIVVRDMSRLLSDENGKEEIFYFEKKMDHFLRQCKKPVIQICYYHPGHFTPAEIAGLSGNHAYRLSKDGLIEKME
ncbi:MAG: PAS domain-containing protein [Deltaproteobacteria bacterium]|nr:PAS domain-containing protein [Deltaproteobacteria bacterium]